MAAVIQREGRFGEGEETGGEALRQRTGGAEVAERPLPVGVAAEKVDFETREARPGSQRRRQVGDEHGPELAWPKVDQEREDDRSRRVRGEAVNDHGTVAVDPAVEGE